MLIQVDSIPTVTYPEIYVEIPFSAWNFGAGAQKDIIVNFEE